MHRANACVIGAVAATFALVVPAVGMSTLGAPVSGVARGELLSAFQPTHVSGPDKGTNTCPVCKYPFNPGVQVWINNDGTQNVTRIVENLEKEARQNVARHLKTFAVFFNPAGRSETAYTAGLKRLASTTRVEYTSIVYLPNPQAEAVSEYKINTSPEVHNTVFVYRARKVAAKFVNLDGDPRGLAALDAAIRKVL